MVIELSIYEKAALGMLVGACYAMLGLLGDHQGWTVDTEEAQWWVRRYRNLSARTRVLVFGTVCGGTAVSTVEFIDIVVLPTLARDRLAQLQLVIVLVLGVGLGLSVALHVVRSNYDVLTSSSE